MKKLLLGVLLSVCPLLAQPYVDTVEVVRLDISGILISYNVNDAAFENNRVVWGTTNNITTLRDSGYHMDWSRASGGSGTKRSMLAGFAPNTTYYFHIQTCDGTDSFCRTDSNWDTSWDCNSGSPDLQEQAFWGSETMTCETSGAISYTTPNPSDPFAIDAPSLDFADPSTWTSNGVFTTIADDAAWSSLNSAWGSCNSSTSDGANELDKIVISSRFDGTGVLDRDFSMPNNDICQFVSDRDEYNWCAPDGVITDPGFEARCTPVIRPNSYGVNSFLTMSFGGTNGDTGVEFKNITFHGPVPGAGDETEGAYIDTTSRVDDNTLDIDTVDAHGISTSGDPNFVVIGGCKTSGVWNTTLNGTHNYSTTDADTIRITGTGVGNAGQCDAGTGWLTQEQEGFEYLMVTGGDSLISCRHCIVDIRFPWRVEAFMRPVSGGYGVFHDSYVPYWGQWAGINPSTSAVDCGAIMSNNCGTGDITSHFYIADGSSSTSWRNVRAQGKGLGLIFSDIFAGEASDLDVKHLASTTPDFMLDAYDDGSDGLDDLVVPGARHGPGIEMKTCVRCNYEGVLIAGGADAATDNQNTENHVFYFRSGSGSDPDGVEHIKLSDIFIENSPYGFFMEGCDPAHTATCHGTSPWKIDNVGFVEFEQRQESQENANIDSAGNLLIARFNQHGQLSRFTAYTSDAFDGNWGPFNTFWGYGNLDIKQGIVPAFRNLDSEVFWSQFGPGVGSDLNPDPDPATTGGELWQYSFGDYKDSAMTDIIWYGWCETANCAVSSSNDASTITETEMEAEDDDTTWTNMTYVGADGEALSARLTELALNNNYTISGSTPGQATEGFDVDEMYDGIGVLTECSGKTSTWDVSSPAAGTMQFCTHVPSGSTRTCYVDVMAQNYGVEGPEGTASLAVDVTGNADPTDDTITRNDGGSWIHDHYKAGLIVEIYDSNGGTNDGFYQVVSATDTVLTLEAVGGGDAGLTTQADDTTLVIEVEPERNSSSGNGADVTITVSGLQTDQSYRWRANCENIPFGWVRDISGWE